MIGQEKLLCRSLAEGSDWLELRDGAGRENSPPPSVLGESFGGEDRTPSLRGVIGWSLSPDSR